MSQRLTETERSCIIDLLKLVEPVGPFNKVLIAKADIMKMMLNGEVDWTYGCYLRACLDKFEKEA